MRVGPSCKRLRVGMPAASSNASVISPSSPPSVSIFEAIVTGSAARARLIESAVAHASSPRRVIPSVFTHLFIFGIPLQEFDRNPLRATDEADADAGTDVVG